MPYLLVLLLIGFFGYQYRKEAAAGKKNTGILGPPQKPPMKKWDTSYNSSNTNTDPGAASGADPVKPADPGASSGGGGGTSSSGGADAAPPPGPVGKAGFTMDFEPYPHKRKNPKG